MTGWLSVFTTAVSLTVLLVCVSLDMTSIDRYVCMGCQSGPAGHGTYFPVFPLPRLVPVVMLAVALVTSPIAAFASSLSGPESRPSDRDAGGAGASGPWPPARPNAEESGFYAYHTFAI